MFFLQAQDIRGGGGGEKTLQCYCFCPSLPESSGSSHSVARAVPSRGAALFRVRQSALMRSRADPFELLSKIARCVSATGRTLSGWEHAPLADSQTSMFISVGGPAFYSKTAPPLARSSHGAVMLRIIFRCLPAVLPQTAAVRALRDAQLACAVLETLQASCAAKEVRFSPRGRLHEAANSLFYLLQHHRPVNLRCWTSVTRHARVSAALRTVFRPSRVHLAIYVVCYVCSCVH